MSVSTAALSSRSLIPQFQNSLLASLTFLAMAAPRAAPPPAANPPVLPSTLVLEAALYRGKATRLPTRHVTAEESGILHRAILASSQIIDQGIFIE
jgi:hypothetical protein